MKLPHLSRKARIILAGVVAAAFVFVTFRSLYAVVLSHGLGAAEYASAVWGALILASFTGWGSALNTLLFPNRRADLGLRCAWGWGATVAVGGLFCATSHAKRGNLFGLTTTGLSFLCLEVIFACVRWAQGSGVRRRRVRLLVADAPFFTGAAAIFVLGVVRSFGAILNNSFNPNDDNLAYFQFAREILERGTLTQPFSLRRVSAYSGKSLLDALQLAIDVPETHLHLLDKGLATLTVLALILGQARSFRRSARSILLLAMLFVVTLPDTGINTTSMGTAAVFFLGLYRTMTWAPVAEGRGLRAALPVALLAAGACTLRQNYLVTIAALLCLAYAPAILRGLRFSPLRVERAALLDAAATAGILVALLVPWCALTFRWSGTFLFPVMKGHYNTAYSFFPARGPLEWCEYLWVNIADCVPIKAAPLFLVAALSMKERTPRRPLAALVGASILGVAMLLFGYPAADKTDQSRYYFGFTFAAVLAIALAVASQAPRWMKAGRRSAEQAACVALVVAGLSMQIYEQRDHTGTVYKAFIAGLRASFAPWTRSSPDPVYQTLQKPVPQAAPIAVLVEKPSHFDHARNRIACLDMIGAVSPPPGIPLARGGDAVAAYLVGQGYRYLVVVSPDAAKSLYKRDVWVKHQKGSEPVWQESAHFYLEAFDAFDDLRRTRVHLAEAGDMVTLDLAAQAP
jgi:hypothetical protein